MSDGSPSAWTRCPSIPVAVSEYNFRYLEGLRCLHGFVSSRAAIPCLTWIFSISNKRSSLILILRVR